MSGSGDYPSAPSAPYAAPAAPPSYQQWPPSNPYSQQPPIAPPAAAPYAQSPAPAHPYQSASSFSQTTGPYGNAPPSGPYYGQPQRPPQWAAPPQGYPPYAYGQQPQPYGQFPPSRVQFPPDTDPEIVRQFEMADPEGTGVVSDYDLQRVLAVGEPFSLRTVRLMLHLFTSGNASRIGPTEFVTLSKALKQWRGVFDRFDKDNSGTIDSSELREALLSLGYAISPSILKVLLSKYDSSGKGKAIEYDKFVECGLVVKGLTDSFKEKDTHFTGSATLSYETFMLMVLPFIVA